jgi:hypothetical protein
MLLLQGSNILLSKYKHCTSKKTTESYIEGRVVYFTFTFNERPLEHILDYVVRGRY